MSKYEGSENTKITLVEAAGELAAELGFDNVSTRAVAERSGENIGSIHYHFGGKTGLFEEVVKSAIADFMEQPSWSAADGLEAANASPSTLSTVIREMVHQQIGTLFNPGKPVWHARVIYQLLQYEGPLYDLFEREVLDPELVAMRKLFLIINPEMGDDDILLHILILNTPVFSHANYMPIILKLLKASSYSEEYLQKLEDLLVCQTQLLLGLPTDK